MLEATTTLGWDLCTSCNYRCPYCGVWQDKRADELRLSNDDWQKIWHRIHRMYGSCHIYMSGGEPSVYPGFHELVLALTNHHRVEICTNLSWDVERLITQIGPGALRIAPTFHPQFAEFDTFLDRAIKIKAYLPNAQIYYVAHPGQIHEMPERSRRLQEHGIRLIPLPLRGDGLALNSDEEKRIIEEVSPYRGEKIGYQLQRISPKGKLCRAGQGYAVIRVNGSVDRCSQYHSGEVGNIMDQDFTLFTEPKLCIKEFCPIESQWIIG